MGCLDPKIDKARTFELLRKKGAVSAEVTFSGGHDEGGADEITLTLIDGSTVALEVWYCGGYTMDDSLNYVPSSEPANEDQELSELLQGPIDESFGTWASVESTNGVLAWDVETATATLHYEQAEYREHEEVI